MISDNTTVWGVSTAASDNQAVSSLTATLLVRVSIAIMISLSVLHAEWHLLSKSEEWTRGGLESNLNETDDGASEDDIKQKENLKGYGDTKKIPLIVQNEL
eukprot:Gb_14847 [translate_table: standard]